MLIAFHIMQQEDHLFRSRQFYDGALKVNALYIAVNARRLCGDSAIQSQWSHRNEFANFRQKSAVNVVWSWRSQHGKGPQKSVGAQLFSHEFIAGHPKSQGVNSVAVFIVNLVIRCRDLAFKNGYIRSQTVDRTLKARRHDLPLSASGGLGLFGIHFTPESLLWHLIVQSICPTPKLHMLKLIRLVSLYFSTNCKDHSK